MDLGLPQNLIVAFKAALRGEVINRGDVGYVIKFPPSSSSPIPRAAVALVQLVSYYDFSNTGNLMVLYFLDTPSIRRYSTAT